MTYSRVVCAVLWLVTVSCMVSASVVVTTAGHQSSPDSDLETSAWLQELFGVTPGVAERRCFDQQKVLHSASKQCFQLLQRGPCGRREWLVFDRTLVTSAGQLEAVCRRRQCAPAWGFDPLTNKCFRQHTCPPPTAFHYTLFGDGKCLCNATTAAFGGVRGCQQLFQDDLCPPGMILAPRYSLLEGMDATCTPDPCAVQQPKTTMATSTTQPSPPLTFRQSQPATPVRFPGDGGIHFGGNHRRAPVKDVFGEMHFPQAPPLVLQMQRRRSNREDSQVTSPRRLQQQQQQQQQRVAAATASQLLFSRAKEEQPSRDSEEEEEDVAPAPAAANQRLNILLPHHHNHPSPSTKPKTLPPPPDTTTTTTTTMTSPTPQSQPLNNDTDTDGGVRLNVKYQDGTSTCHSGVELSTTCALQMKPLFSDLSDVKVPLCVDTWFRFAIGRVGKSEECVTNDDGVCAAKVNVASSEPFDWDFE